MMQIFHSFADLQTLQRPVHWALGFFDGVHRGHRRVIESADTPGALRGVLSFAEHPLALLRPEAQPKLLTPHAGEKARLLEELGADVLLQLPFTRELAALAPEAFLDALRAACPMAGISVGSNWRFGRGGCGDTAFVQAYAAQHGLRACVQPLLEVGGESVCSSRIRAVLQEGRMAEVAELLGHAFCICAEVEPGQKLARKLGFPTANMRVQPQAALPPFGVYAVRAEADGQLLRGVANLGIRPTIDEAQKVVRLETHFLNWSGDLYGRELRVQLERFLRPERKFDSLDALRAQMQRDKDLAESEM